MGQFTESGGLESYDQTPVICGHHCIHAGCSCLDGPDPCDCGGADCAECAPHFYATADQFSAEEIKERFKGHGLDTFQAYFMADEILCPCDDVDEDSITEEEFGELILEREQLIIEALQERGLELAGVIREGSGRWWLYEGNHKVWWIAHASFTAGVILHAAINN